MGFKLGEDSIGALSHNTGVLTLAASLLTIGGQQYRTSALSRTIATDVTPQVAQTLYIIFAVLNAGNVELRVSANMNSVGPAGFTAWAIVGAFYSNNTPALGSFVNISGVPKSDFFNFTSVASNVSGFTSGPAGFIRRDGARGIGQVGFIKNGSAGVGATAINLSLGAFSYATSPAGSDVANATFVQGYGLMDNVPNSGFNAVNSILQGAAGLSMAKLTTGSSLTGADIVAGAQASWVFDCQITGWSNTQLKDL